MKVRALDHLVLTVTDRQRSVDFYTRVLGMRAETFGDDRIALHFGDQKINLHEADKPIEPHATHPLPGTADLCFIVEGRIENTIDEIQRAGATCLFGPVDRTGARGPLRSIYLRDPDGNLIELASHDLPP